MATQTVRLRFWLLAALALVLSAVMGTTLLAGSSAEPAVQPPVQPEAVTLEPAGHFGGWLSAIAVPAPSDLTGLGDLSGLNYLYLGEGSGFTVYDVADKAHPRQVAGLPLDGDEVTGIALAGDKAYLVNGTGLRVVSLANPVKPAVLSGLDLAGGQGIALAGPMAYIAGGGAGLLIVDVSNPLSPTLRGTYDTPGNARAVQVVGSTAYVADDDRGLQVINVANPAAPALLGTYDTPGTALDVQVVGTTAYVADSSKGLQIINVSNPVSPARLGFYDTPGSAQDVEVVGAIAYVADFDSGLQILNVSNPISPTLLATVADWRADVAKISGNYAYVGSSGQGLRVLDVSHPASPVVLGSYERPSALSDLVMAMDQVPGTSRVGASRYAYAVGMRQFWTLDMTELTLPRPLARLAAVGATASVAVSGTLAYVTEDQGLTIVNASDPLSPTRVSSYTLPGGAWVRDLAVHGAYAYVPTARHAGPPTGWTDGCLRIVDVSNPLSPTLAASFPTPGNARRAIVAGHAGTGKTLAYVADGAGGLRIVDVTNPRAPVALGAVSPPTTTATTDAVVAAGGRVLVGHNRSNESWLQLLDVANPVSPAVLDTYHLDAPINDIAEHGSDIFLSVAGRGITWLQINQDRLQLVTEYPLPHTQAIAYVGAGGGQRLRLDQAAAVASIQQSSGISFVTSNAGQPTPTRTPTATPTSTRTPTITPTPTIPPVQAWVDEKGVLHIVLQGDADAAVTVKDGNVLVNDQPVGDPPAKAADIKGIEVQGGTGNNTIDLRGVRQTDFTSLRDGKIHIDAGDGYDWVYGSAFGDVIEGGAETDTIWGDAGNDQISGGSERDWLWGEDGDDALEGGDNADELKGGPGDDTLNGNDGGDELEGGDGDDSLYGGGGNDELRGGDGNDVLYGGLGDDYVVAWYGDDTIISGYGNDTVSGGDGNDTYKTVPGSADTLTDDGGDDTVDFSDAAAGITLDLDQQDVDQVVDAAGNTVQLEGQLENFVGSAFDDVVSVVALTVTRRLEGGPHSTGDTLNFDAKGAWVTDDGRTIIAAGYAPVTYTGFETVVGTRPCPPLAPGASWEQVFTVAGTYPYYDAYAPGHTGTVVVGPNVGQVANLSYIAAITITDAGFDPPAVTIAAGNTVRWTNRGVGVHAVRGGAAARTYLPLVVRQ